ncbi:NAD(P)-dependent dehydrogenase (short-subunit alcohol dehydrogenase family) [Yoonia maricola]|uniref:NAD(P)-dependent dehydrogenase (Short-subunit alcohol dehydrogenase family) n=1 Tax=Yoonia maricola TaxID=420999 RepID=A0A2M8W088_9RHOB|nr:SDR family oxidoreductase [Yoonia maricola]PJI84334.1 NAD(P)-dependent dehydrogenase (short-subunit alcohol dehydrogenase family) [Yoonia maricola]
MTSHLPLKNETVLVTGATGGIGRTIVRRVAELGGHPILHYRSNEHNAQALLEAIDGHGTLVRADLAEKFGARELWEAAENSVGRIGSLVNNAGMRVTTRIEDDFDDWSQAWDADLQVNLRAPADLCRMAIRHFRTYDGGRIINIASRAGQRGYTANHMPYGASKAGLLNLTKTIARSFGDEGIIAIGIAPGFVRTEMAEEFIRAKGKDAAVGDIPIGEMVEPSEVAELVCFALRPDQRSLSGATLDLNGASYVR